MKKTSIRRPRSSSRGRSGVCRLPPFFAYAVPEHRGEVGEGDVDRRTSDVVRDAVGGVVVDAHLSRLGQLRFEGLRECARKPQEDVGRQRRAVGVVSDGAVDGEFVEHYILLLGETYLYYTTKIK